MTRQIQDYRLGIDLDQELELLYSEQRWEQSGHNAKTLIRNAELSVVLIVMRSATRISQQHAAASLTLQALHGSVRVAISERIVVLARGHILSIKAASDHEIEAFEDSALLLSIGRDQSRAMAERSRLQPRVQEGFPVI